jgi:glycolate oxidase FAD binding subunit
MTKRLVSVKPPGHRPVPSVAGSVADVVDGIRAGRVVRVSDVEAVRRFVVDATAASEAFVATGRGAHLDVGAIPSRLDAILDVSALERVAGHEAADMTVTVEAGCTLDALDRTLAAAGQWLPFDPPRFDETTVGGLVAANLSGPLRASQGTVRDLLIGLRVVGAGGALVSGGGKVVKNVAGYDLPKLHVGALGTIGVVVEATFKVRPKPEVESAALLPARTPAEAATVALAVRDVIDPLWLEAGVFRDQCCAVVGLGGIPAEVSAARRSIEAVAARHRAIVDWRDEGTVVRRMIGGFGVEPAAATIRVSVLPGDVPFAMTKIARAAGGVPVLASVASGVVRARLDDPASVQAAVTALRASIEPRGGFVVVERAVPEVKRAVDVWGNPGEGLALMRRVKATFDPAGIFAPGRFVGGI